MQTFKWANTLKKLQLLVGSVYTVPGLSILNSRKTVLINSAAKSISRQVPTILFDLELLCPKE